MRGAVWVWPAKLTPFLAAPTVSYSSGGAGRLAHAGQSLSPHAQAQEAAARSRKARPQSPQMRRGASGTILRGEDRAGTPPDPVSAPPPSHGADGIPVRPSPLCFA